MVSKKQGFWPWFDGGRNSFYQWLGISFCLYEGPPRGKKQKKHTTLEALIFLIKKTPSALNECYKQLSSDKDTEPRL